MSELRQLIERLKHGKHDQSTHGRRGRRGGGGGGGGGGGASSGGSSKPIVEPATSSESKPDDVVDGVKLTKYDRDVIDATKELTRNGIKPSPSPEQTMEYARSAANDINSAGFLERSVYGSSLETLEITPDGKLERREYPYIAGIGKYTHTPRQIRRVVNALRETGRRVHYISNDAVDSIVISGQ
jgi:hypothetical protein